MSDEIAISRRRTRPYFEPPADSKPQFTPDRRRSFEVTIDGADRFTVRAPSEVEVYQVVNERCEARNVAPTVVSILPVDAERAS